MPTPRLPFNPLFSLQVLLAVVLFTLPSMVVVIALPGRQRRRRVAHWSARALFRLIGIPLKVHGLSNLPAACIVAANHASYLDGIVLTAALPPRFGFIIKREAMRAPLVGWMLTRLGSEFVERFDKKAARQDASRIIQRARGGMCLGVFPEGTFVAQPGLRAFHLGGFMAATRAGLPVVPLVIRGTRDILPAHRWWPRPGAVQVDVLEPVAASGRNGDAARAQRDRVRDAILAQCGEPDHAHHHAHPHHHA